ncbi:MAG: tRNA preQ1(34) S-adenosylmethionine ribosyltransferase-isomerase QueA [Cyanobacteriota bacterium]|nr:tRNA preQ1(34) S-adenosylmethionine ribosyltransferase-isomerase QueA [Cyanobacteriota bacterium]
MTSADDLLLSSYDFDLPREAIAQRPVEPRHSARLLLVEPRRGARHRTVWDWAEELQPGDLIVVNDTRVLQARLRARRASGGAVEVLVLRPSPPRPPTGDAPRGEEAGSDWLCLLKPAKRVKIGEALLLDTPEGTPCEPPLSLRVVGQDPASGGRVLRFPAGLGDAGAMEPFLQRHGTMPLPPYIQDGGGVAGERYQTRYAARPGAVAAPTAGLHLSDALLERLRERGVERATVTLHVGLGTFRPLEQERLEGLELHSEWVEVSEALVEAVAAARARGGRVVAVGTTCVRSLEGVAALHGGALRPHAGPINLVIQPGHRFAVVEGLLTNFHLPRSSLLLLVSALIGRERLLALYGEAIREGYRFFSFGDAMWIPPEAVVVAR